MKPSVVATPDEIDTCSGYFGHPFENKGKSSTDGISECDVKVVLVIVRQEQLLLKRTCCSISSTLGGGAGR
jgi:hypothetical protein